MDISEQAIMMELEILKLIKIIFLGVVLDNKFTWKSSIDYIIRKIGKNISILYKHS